jgi:cell division protease FtsH
MNDDFSRSDRDGRSGSNLVMWLVLVAVLLAFVGMWAVQTLQEEIGLFHLERLIAASQIDAGTGELAAGKTGYIDVPKEEKPDEVIRYSHLRDVVVGDEAVSGHVTKQAFRIEKKDGKETFVPLDNNEAREVTFYSRKQPTDNEYITALLRENKVPFEKNTGPNVWKEYGLWLVLMAGGFVLFYFVLRRLGGAGSPMSFGRSRGKLYAQEDLGVTFNDVAGIDEAMEEVKEVVDFLRNAEKYQSLGGRIPKGVLLVGPPGTGKTLLAKAIAGEAGVPFFSLSGSDFVEMFVGVGAARVRDMFQQAEAKAPCIIFIDELDALGKSRGAGMMGGHDEREQTLNALLVEMDGFGSNSGVIVMAATNRPETLDAALLRPGRFDRHVLVDRPDIRGREAILKVHVKNVKLDPTVDLNRVASITPGFVGADLANLVNEAALLAARKGRSAVGMDEFNEGVERVQIGLEKKQRVMNDDEKLRVAYHESGHAVVAYSLPNTDPVHKVSIIPRGIGALGYVLRRPEGDRFLRTQSELESNIQVALGGTLAEEIFLGDFSTGDQSDLEHATQTARSMVMEFGMSNLGRINYRERNQSLFLAGSGDETPRSHSETTAREIDMEVRRIITDAFMKTREILETRRHAVEALSRKLMEVESVDADELKRIIDENTHGPIVVPGTKASPAHVKTVIAPIDSPATGTAERGI